MHNTEYDTYYCYVEAVAKVCIEPLNQWHTCNHIHLNLIDKKSNNERIPEMAMQDLYNTGVLWRERKTLYQAWIEISP